MSVVDKLEKELFPEGRTEEPNLLYFFCCLSDPRTSFETFHSFEGWKMHNIQLIKMHSRKTGYCFIDAGGRDTYKCLSKNTKINVEGGADRTVEDLYQTGDFPKIYALDENDMKIKTVNDYTIKQNGIKTVYRMELTDGRNIDVTSNHPFFTYAGWKKLEELKKGDFLAVPRCLKNFGENEPDEDFAKILAYLISDGCLKGKTIFFSQKNQTILNDFKKAVKSFDEDIQVKKKKGNNVDYYLTGAKKLSECLSKADQLGRGSADKYIPDEIMTAKKRIVSSFLSRLFSTDGSCTKFVKNHNKEINYVSISEKLIFQIQTLLLRFGIKSMVRKYHGTKKYKKNIFYKIEINTKDDIIIFFKKIGFFGKDDRTLPLLKYLSKIKSQNNRDVIPIDILNSVDDIRKKKGITIYQLEGNFTGNKNKQRFKKRYSPTREKLLRYAFSLDSDYLTKFAKSDVIWRKIKSITRVGKIMTYDLTVPIYHNFVANNIISHNTQIDIEIIRERATLGIFEKSIYLVKGEVHLVTMQDELEKMFDIHPYLRLIKGAWNKRDRTFRFNTNHLLYLRILGSDVGGSSKAQAAHVHTIIIDEAELASSDLIGNVMHAMLPNCILWISGVVNDDRTSALFSAIKNKVFSFFKFASYEGGNWTPEREQLYIEEYGGKNTKGWRNQVEGLWNEQAYGVIPEEDVEKCITTSAKFRFIFDRLDVKNAADYKDILRFNYLPDALEPEYYVGMDVGNTIAPSEILIGAKIHRVFAGAKNEKKKSGYKKIIIHRIQINRVLGSLLTEIVDYVMLSYSMVRGAMDAHVVGAPYFHSLQQEPYLDRNYKDKIFPFRAQENIRKGWEEDPETGKINEQKVQQKHFSTYRLASEFMQEKYLIPKEGTSELVKSILGEHSIRRLSSKYPIYENYYKSLEHLFDALRALELAIWLENEYPGLGEYDVEDEVVDIVPFNWRRGV